MQSASSESSKTDHWKEWLLKRRHGDDPDFKKRSFESLLPVRAKLLDKAGIALGETVLDVGTGDGFIGIGALEKVGPTGHVIFTDISEPLVDICREFATESGTASQCEFVIADATDLSQISSGTVDVVTMRSVLIYVQDKQKAIDECYRVLKPGGRVSIFEPVAKLEHSFIEKGNYLGYNVLPLKDLFEKMNAISKKEHDSQSTMSDFDERDLMKMFTVAKFGEMHMDLELHIGNQTYFTSNWDSFVNSSPNPLVSTLREQMDGSLTAEEMVRFEKHLRPLVEQGVGRIAQALVYIVAKKL